MHKMALWRAHNPSKITYYRTLEPKDDSEGRGGGTTLVGICFLQFTKKHFCSYQQTHVMFIGVSQKGNCTRNMMLTPYVGK